MHAAGALHAVRTRPASVGVKNSAADGALLWCIRRPLSADFNCAFSSSLRFSPQNRLAKQSGSYEYEELVTEA